MARFLAEVVYKVYRNRSNLVTFEKDPSVYSGADSGPTIDHLEPDLYF